MSLHPLYGHDSLVNRLEGAIASGRFPQTVLLTGPAGVGKQRIALKLAEAILCHDDGVNPVGRSARQVQELVHPDLHWFVPIVLTKKSSDPQKHVEEAEDRLAEAMAERRENPIYRAPNGQASHSVASARLLQRRVALTPFQAKRKVFILGDADRLIVQESSQEAANALLKVLEEPPADTVLMLTTSVPDALLPTVRSRMVPIRVGPVGDDHVRDFLESELDMPSDRASRLTSAVAGSIGKAIEAMDAADERNKAAKRFLSAVRDGPAAWAGEALVQPPWGARGGFTAMLDALAVELRSELQTGAGNGNAGKYLEAVRLVEQHRATAQGNVNPQLALVVLASEMAEIL